VTKLVYRFQTRLAIGSVCLVECIEQRKNLAGLDQLRSNPFWGRSGSRSGKSSIPLSGDGPIVLARWKRYNGLSSESVTTG